MNPEKYIGMDAHQATISVAVLDSSGKLIVESILETQTDIDPAQGVKWRYFNNHSNPAVAKVVPHPGFRPRHSQA